MTAWDDGGLTFSWAFIGSDPERTMPTSRLIALALVLAAGCRAAEPDAPQRPTPRVVAIGGNVTEAIFAVGAGDLVVGVDTSSLHPPEAAALPKVGDLRQVAVESVLSLRPDMVIATEDAGPPAALMQLRAAGVEVMVFTGAPTVAGARERLTKVGQVLWYPQEAAALVARMDADLAALAKAVAARPERPRVLALYARGADVMNVAGRGTAADHMLALAGATNAVTDFEGYRPLTGEGVVAAAPEVILVPESGLVSLGGIDGLLSQPGVAQTPAGRARRVVAMNDVKLLGFGPRTAQAARELAEALHPGLGP